MLAYTARLLSLSTATAAAGFAECRCRTVSRIIAAAKAEGEPTTIAPCMTGAAKSSRASRTSTASSNNELNPDAGSGDEISHQQGTTRA